MSLYNTETSIPANLYHYYERARGPFLSITSLPIGQAETLLDEIRSHGEVFASQRSKDYLCIRRKLEHQIRQLFIAKGGNPRLFCPHYLVLGSCPWLLRWYKESAVARIPLAAIDSATVSFTYGDSYPAMRVQDGRPYRGLVYTLAEPPGLIREYGLPQHWNPDGEHGPERYIEAQVWDDGPIDNWRNSNEP